MTDTPQILIVDAQSSMRKVVALCCGHAGFDTTQVDTAIDALDRAATSSYHLVITDHLMPQMDGVELCRQLRTFERHEHTPVIMISSIADQIGADSLCAELGRLVVLSKPLDLAELRRVISDNAPPPSPPQTERRN